MPFVLTVIADPASGALSADLAARLAAALTLAGARIGAAVWLAPGTALDVTFEGVTPGHADTAVGALLDALPVDRLVQPVEGRRKRLLLADMESTIIRQEMLDELAESVGKRDEVAAITARAMAGELDFAAALRARVAMLAGLPATVLDRAAERIELMPGARALVQTMRAAGACTALVSGGFTHFTALVRDWCGFDLDRANRLLVADGRLTGEPGEPILGREAKLATLNELTAARGLDPADTLAVGDGANDLPMLLAAGLGVAYHAKPVLRQALGARIDHGDLTALLYLQGYHAGEIVRD